MFDWENLRYFVAIAQAGSLSGAARALKVDHATVGRRLGALETELQAQLVERLPRACRLTTLGQQVLLLANGMEGGAYAITRAVRAAQSPLTGRVTLSVPPVLATNLFAQHLSRFQQLHPHILLSIASQAHSAALARREADIALRLFRPTEADNVTRKLGSMPFALYASVRYEHVASPDDWGFITYEAQHADRPHQQWLLAVAGQRRVVCEVSDITTQQMAARSGVGVAGLPTFIGDSDATLQRLATDGPAFSREIWLVVHADLRASPLLRAAIDFCADVVATVAADH